jgi:4-hydroxyphenylpyruvate dioxygenase
VSKIEKFPNPVGLDGVNFVEFSGADKTYLQKLFESYGFKEVSLSKTQEFGEVSLYRQGNVNFILNCVENSFARNFAKAHGPCISATGLQVFDAEKAFQTAVARGARAFTGQALFGLKAVYGIGDSLIYFVDSAVAKKLYTEVFTIKDQDLHPPGVGFKVVDHFTNNVPVGEMQKWADFYTNVFGFRETRFFDIRGKTTGLLSKVMRSPCDKFAIPINEPTDSKSQIQEYLDEYKGSGVQHLALLSDSIIDSLNKLKASRLEFLTPPPGTYYEMIPNRIPGVQENLKTLQELAVLVDGDDEGYLLQIFSKNIIGPIFFEIIQRRNHKGFGEGNFQALFDAIERDQKARGYI